METEKVGRNQKELVMSDLGTSISVRGSKMASQDKMTIEKLFLVTRSFVWGID